ncbi:hypothetical protein [Aliiroseovarius crassostreae]|uniref:hypothetical protein n=1 Tax=Aliiroseovarius crassostreae TaxID=154981 RepID=UPI003C7C1598
MAYSPDLTHDNWAQPMRTFVRLAMILREMPHLWRLLPVLGPVLGWPQARLKDRLKSLHVCLTTASLLSRFARLGQSAVLDQGPMQAVWSAMLMSPNPGDTGKVLRKMQTLLPDHHWHLVFVDAPDDILRERLAQRPVNHSRLHSGTTLARPDVWAHARENLSYLIKHLPPSSQGKQKDLIRVQTGDLTPERSARHILRHLGNIPPAPTQPTRPAPAPTDFTIGGNPQGNTADHAKHLLTCNTSSKNRSEQ